MKVTVSMPIPDLIFRAMKDIQESWRLYRRRWALIAFLILAIFGPRLVSLGSILTIDEPLWLSRGSQFMKGLASFHFDKTLVAGQPGVTTAWLIGMATPWESLAAAQAAIAMATGMLLLITTYFLIQLVGFRWGLFTGFLLAFDPFLLGHSRVAHTDALLALFALTSYLSLLAGLLPTIEGKAMIRRYLIASGIFMGGAFLTKIFALILIPFFLLTILFFVWRTERSGKAVVRFGLLWMTMVALTVYILWPVLWLHADKAFLYLTERGTLHAEGTREEQTTSVWWYYARETVFRLTPFTTIFFLVGVGSLFWGKNLRIQYTMVWLLLAGIWYAFMLNLGSDKSDRYLLFSLIIIPIVAAYGLREGIRWGRTQWKMEPFIATSAMLLALATVALPTLRLHPYYLAHYNWLYPIEQTHKLGWGEGLEQAAAWIQTQHPQASVASYYARVFDYFYPGEVVDLKHRENKDYIVLYRSMFERGTSAVETDILNQYIDIQKPVHTITINGLPYVWIYAGSASP